MHTVQKAVRAPGLFLLKMLFWTIYFFQKMANNVEGVSKMPIMDQLKGPTIEGGFAQSAERIGAFQSDTSLGWYIKALFGPIVDNLPIFGYRRKSWLIITSLLCMLAWGWVALFGQSTVALLFIGILFVNLFIAMGDVITDGMMVEFSQKMESEQTLPAGTVNRVLQSAQWFGAMTAVTIGAIGGGIIAQFFELKSAAVVSGLMPMLLILLVAVAVKEEKVAWDWEKARKGLLSIWIVVVVALAFVAFSRAELEGPLKLLMPLVKLNIIIGAMSLVVKIPRQLYVPAAFLICWFFIPFSLDGGYCVSYFTQHSEHFLTQLRSTEGIMGWLWQMLVTVNAVKQEELNTMLAAGNGLADLYYGSVLGTAGAFGGVIGAVAFGTRLNGVPLHRLLQACIVVQVVLVLWFAFIYQTISPIHLVVFGFTGSAMSLIVLLGALSYSAAIIPRRDQAALFAFLMSMCNIGQQYGVQVIGGTLYDHFGGVNRVTNAAGDTEVVMQNAGSGMVAVLGLSLGVLVLLVGFVAWLHKSGGLSMHPDE